MMEFFNNAGNAGTRAYSLARGEVTVCGDPKQARALSEFLARCAQEMEANPVWEQKHFSGGKATDFVVFNSRKERG